MDKIVVVLDVSVVVQGSFPGERRHRIERVIGIFLSEAEAQQAHPNIYYGLRRPRENEEPQGKFREEQRGLVTKIIEVGKNL